MLNPTDCCIDRAQSCPSHLLRLRAPKPIHHDHPGPWIVQFQRRPLATMGTPQMQPFDTMKVQVSRCDGHFEISGSSKKISPFFGRKLQAEQQQATQMIWSQLMWLNQFCQNPGGTAPSLDLAQPSEPPPKRGKTVLALQDTLQSGTQSGTQPGTAVQRSRADPTMALPSDRSLRFSVSLMTVQLRFSWNRSFQLLRNAQRTCCCVG